MKRLILALAVFLALIVAGCQQEGKEVESAEMLIGSGATFPQPQIEKWIDEYAKVSGIKIEYTGKGSGGGQNDFKQSLVDFACSDPPLKENLWKELEQKGQPLQFPIITGAVVIAYNIPEVDELRLDGKTLADIFIGNIEYWDDPRIAEQNEVNLPHERIIVVHRSDSSGTTDIFTNYLSIVSDEWSEKVGAGKTVEWYVDKKGRGVGGKGNAGVVAAIKNNEYSIGYTELAYVYKEGLKTVALKNKAEKYVIASPETIKQAVSKVSVNVPSVKEGYKEDIKALLNAEGTGSYPIVAFSHMVIWEKYGDKSKEEAIRKFVTWVLTEGQKESNLVAGYVGLPEEISDRIISELGL